MKSYCHPWRIGSICLLFLLSCFGYVSAADTDQVERITVEQVKNLLDHGEKIVFLDTRNPHDWAASEQIIPGARRVANDQDLAKVLKQIPPDSKIVTYCT